MRMRMSTIQHCTQMRRRHILALFNVGYLHKNNCNMIVAQFSAKMPGIRPMQIWRFDGIAVSALNGQQFRCFYQQNNEELIAEFHNATKVAAFPLELESQEKFEQKPVDGHQILAQRAFSSSAQHTGEQPDFIVEYGLGTTGQKTIQIHKRHLNEFMDFKKILVPEDIFSFVQAMDEVLNAVQAKRDEIERTTGDKRLHIVKAKGRYYDYQMKLTIYNRIVDVQLQSMANAARLEHKGKLMILPLPAFHWLRHAIGELFAANGEEHIQHRLGEPPALPEWLRLDSPAHVLSPTNNHISLQQSHGIMATQPQNVLMNNAEAVEGEQNLAERSVPLAQHGQQKFNVRYRMGRSGQKFLQFIKAFGYYKFYEFANICVPKDVFAFVQAMDRLLNAMHANKEIIETHTNQPRSSQLVLHREKAAGKNYDFELDLYINKDGQVEVALRSVPNQAAPEHKPKRMYLPLRHFHWLRHAIEEILAENGMRFGRTSHYPDSFPHAFSPENHQKLSQQQPQNRTNIFQTQQQRRVAPFVAQPQQEKVDGHQILAQRGFPSSAQHTGEQPDLIVEYELGTTGQKTIQIHQRHFDGEFFHFRKILVPEDIFSFVQAMDKLLNAVHAKKNEIETIVDDNNLHIVEAKGLNYDYQLKLVIYNRIVDVRMGTLPNAATPAEQKPRHMTLSLPAFHWLRHTIGALFAANGEEHIQLQLGEPPALPEWLLNKEMALDIDKQQILAEKGIPLDQHGQQQLIVFYKMGRNRRKFFYFIKKHDSESHNFGRIHVPEDVFAFVQAMDQLLNAVHAKRGRIEAHINRPKSLHLGLHKAKSKGIFYDFELALYINKMYQVEVGMETLPNEHNPEHKPTRTYLPLRHFHWLRHRIGEMLAADIGVELGKPPYFPEWLNLDSMPHTFSPENYQKLPQNFTNISQSPQQWQPQQRRVASLAAQPQQHAQMLMERQLQEQEQFVPAPGRTTVEMERLHRLVQQQQKQLKQMQTAMNRMTVEQRRELKNNEQMTELINLLHRKMSNESADEQSNRNSNDK